MRSLGIASPGRRIVVVGTTGSGKTFVAQRLAEMLRVTYVSNDAILFRENWQPASPTQRLAQFDAVTRGQGWTIDGNIGALKSADDRLIAERADTMVWLDLPRHVVTRQLLIRTISRSWHKTELWHGNRETWRRSFFSRESVLWWSWKTFDARRREYEAIFADPMWSHLSRIRLRSRLEINRWLTRLRQGLEKRIRS